MANDQGPRTNGQRPLSIQPDQKYFAFSRVGVVRYFLGPLAVVLRYSDAHPPVTHRTAEAQYFRGLVTPGEPFPQATWRSFRRQKNRFVPPIVHRY